MASLPARVKIICENTFDRDTVPFVLNQTQFLPLYSPYKLPQSSRQDEEHNSMNNDELRGIYFTLPQQKLFRG